MKHKSNRIIALIAVFVLVFLIGEISYSYFVYEKDLVEAQITMGNIQMSFTNTSESLNLVDQLPMSDVLGKSSNHYIDFTITGSTDSESIKYEIEMVSNSDNTLDDKYVKVYLTDQNDLEIVSPILVSDLENAKANNGKKIYSDIIEANSDGARREYSQNYRLRVWIDEDSLLSESKQYGFNIYLYAENDEKLLI